MILQSDQSTIFDALKGLRTQFTAILLASAFVNFLYLNSSLFMIQVYDRVLLSKSVATLISISSVVVVVFIFHGTFEYLRSRILVRVAGHFDATLNASVFERAVRRTLSSGGGGDGMELLRDMDLFRAFLSGAGLVALIDLPWIVIYVAVCFAFHYMFGIACIVGILAMTGLAYCANANARRGVKYTNDALGRRNSYVAQSQKNAEVVAAMGMMPNLSRIWVANNADYMRQLRSTSDILNAYAVVTRIFRMMLQSSVLATGAILVIAGEISSGVLIAASILTSRALAPVEQIVGQWKQLLEARNSWIRMKAAFANPVNVELNFDLPKPVKSIQVVELSGSSPGRAAPIFEGVSFELRAGSAMGVVGSSASGKSTLARCLLQLWPSTVGTIRLDGSELTHWDKDTLGTSIGYLPQDVELFSGTIAQNISRFEAEASAESVIAAARAAGVHQMICGLPKGYATEIGGGGAFLSAGQRQRIALARALFKEPFLVVLDEPNSNLDTAGEQALADAIKAIRHRGGIAIVIAHRTSILASMDYLLVMERGRMKDFGSYTDVSSRLSGVPKQKKLTVVVQKSAE